MALIPLKNLVPGALAGYKAGAPGASDFVGAATGATVQDTQNGVLYINSGTPANPVWVKVGAQS